MAILRTTRSNRRTRLHRTVSERARIARSVLVLPTEQAAPIYEPECPRSPAIGRALEGLGNAGRSPMGERLSPLETAIQARRVRGSRVSRFRLQGCAVGAVAAQGGGM